MSLLALCLTTLSIFQPVTSFAIPRQSIDNSPSPIAVGFYAGWHATSTPAFPLSNISWDKYDTLIYSFATTTPSVTSLSLSGSDVSLLPEFVCEAHEHGVAAHVSIGGWTGSGYFSSNIATPENRTAFVMTVANFADEYNLDGINFDWEYPAKQGIGCNTISPNDTGNFLAFLQELRAYVGPSLTISAAVTITTFEDATGNPSKNVTGFAEVFDYIVIMAYDIMGPWSSSVGPNAPLNDTCAPPADQQGSAVSAVKAWNDAGMPINQMVFGVAGYAHSYSVAPSNAFVNGPTTELAPYPKFNASNQPLGDAWDNTSGNDTCGVFQAQGGTYRLWSLIEDGYLTADGNPAPGIYYRYDDCSQTPFVYNKVSEVMLSFDNAQSFAAKGKYIKDYGLKGFALWEVADDHDDILLDSIRLSAGISN